MRKKKIKGSSTLQSLTALALALPGISTNAHADDVPYNKTQLDLKYSHYHETSNRYKIDVYQADFKIPINESFDAAVYFQQDAMAGASTAIYAPIAFNFVPGGSLSDLIETKTGASIRDRRDEFGLKGRWFKDNFNAGLKISYSTEHDYNSLTLGADSKFSFNKKNTDLLLGVSMSDDQIKRSPDTAGHPWDSLQAKGKKSTYRFMLGLKQDLSKTTYMQVNAEADFDRGYLSDAYKKALIHGDATAARTDSQFVPYAAVAGILAPGTVVPLGGVTIDYDRRPRIRKTYALVGHLVHAIESLKSSIHGNYRFGINDWGIQSHTFEAAYFQPIGDGWDISVLGRYYAQSEARFYGMAFSVAPGSPFPAKSIGAADFASSDYRLTYFGSFGGELKVMKAITPQIKANILAGVNIRKGSYSFLGKSKWGNPTNNFNTYYLSAQMKFEF
ncbi:MAG: DUF3570 domain-containing protein [Candidatus Nucleicultricaceae bacterium]